MAYNSPDDFLQKHSVNTLVQDALNATYASGSTSPVAFLAQYFKERNTVNAIQSVTAQEVQDGCGSVALEVRVELANGVVGKAVSSHCNHHFHGLAITGSLLPSGNEKESKSEKKGAADKNADAAAAAAAAQQAVAGGGNVGHPSTARVAVLKTDRIPTVDAKELRRQRHAGNGLLGSAALINAHVGPAFVGLPVNSQEDLDAALQTADGTENFAQLGAQCAAAVSVALAQTASHSKKQPAFVQVASNFYSNVGIPRSLHVPTPVITLFSAEPKWLGKVRVLEVCLVPNLQSCAAQAAGRAPGQSASATPGGPAGGGSNPPAQEDGEDAVSVAGVAEDMAESQAGGVPGATSGDNAEAGGTAPTGSAGGVGENTTTRLGSISTSTTPNAVRQALSNCSRVIEEAQAKLHEDGHVVVVNSDGGLKFNTADSLTSLVEYAEDCVKEAGFTLGVDMFLALIIDGSYCFKPETQKYALVEGQQGGDYSGAQLAEYLATFIKETKKGKIVYLEDPLTEKDATEMKRLMYRLGGTNTAVSSNNYTAGNSEKMLVSAQEKQFNCLTLRLNDCGSVSNVISLGQQFQQQYPGAALAVAGEAFLGNSSGEFLADLATGVGAKFLRGGGLLRPDHAAVYNRLVDIEGELEELGLASSSAQNGGKYYSGPADLENLELPAAPLEPVVEVNVKESKKRK